MTKKIKKEVGEQFDTTTLVFSILAFITLIINLFKPNGIFVVSGLSFIALSIINQIFEFE